MPFPSQDELAVLYGAGYFERWGVSDAHSMAAVRAAKEATYRRFLAALPPRVSGGRLLDLGCAFGFLLGVARERGYDAYGLDPNADVIEYAKREFGGHVHAGPLDARAFPGVYFRVVTLIDVLEHIVDPAGLLSALAERLEPGGVVLAVVPNAASLTRRVLGRRWPHYAPEHLFLWTPRALRRFATSHGWKVIQLRTGIRKTFTVSYLESYAKVLGQWLPPGLKLLGSAPFSAPTGELLALLERNP